MRALGLAVLAMMLGVAVFAIPPRAGGSAAPRLPTQTIDVDLDPWFLDDEWTYASHVVTRDPDGTFTDTALTVTTSVELVQSVSATGYAYTVYNLTAAGTFSSSGTIPVPTFGVRPYALSGTVSGWTWTDRSNIAIVRTNSSTSGAGFVQLPIFGNAPLTVRSESDVTFSPAREDLDFPLQANDLWSYNVTTNTTGFVRFRVETIFGPIEDATDLTNSSREAATFRVVSLETVTVPAGTFLTVRIASPDDSDVRWYGSTVKNIAKAESHAVAAVDDYAHSWTNLSAYAVGPPPWPGSISLTPRRVNPGGWITAAGSANPNEVLAVRIPAAGETHAVAADASGAWALRFRAPTIDDYSPADADVGSHGVLVEPSTSPSGWDVATVQLILPDLFVGSEDLTLSNGAPSAGTLLTLNGTAHASPDVDIRSGFNLSFTVDGVEIARLAMAELNAGETATAGTAWTTVAGTHTIAFRADADDEVHERNETNNTAGFTLFVSGPDLAPWNIVIDAEADAAYGDPAATGYASSPLAARVGGVVNITFEAASVGTAEVPAPFVVEVVETVGLRGPPKPGWRFAATVTTPVPPGGRAGPWMAKWDVPTLSGVYALNVTVDGERDVAEESEANNTFVVVLTVAGPDYIVASVVAPPKVTAGSGHTIEVTVRNDGELSGSRDVALAAFEDSATMPFFTATVAALAVAEARAMSVPWTATASGGVVTLRFVIDFGDVLDEMVEDNNEASVPVDVRLPPITELTVQGSNVSARGSLFVTSSALFVLTATDQSDTGLTTHYAIDSGAATVYTTPFRLFGDGPHRTAYWSEDNLGGTEGSKAFFVVVDTTPPTATATPDGRTEGNLTLAWRNVTVTAEDDGVGVAFVLVRIDNGTWTRFDGAVAAVRVEGVGDHVVTFRTVDLLGNEGPVRSVSVRVDLEAFVPPNLKPVVAAAFGAVLLAFALVLRRQDPRMSVTSPTAIAFAFAAAELGTGALSIAIPALTVPASNLGVGVDAALLVAGVLIPVFLRLRAGAVLDRDAPTSK